MKKLKIMGIPCFLMLLASSSFAAYTIEVCAIPLSEIVIGTAKPLVSTFNFQHVFVRGNDGKTATGLNFESKDPMEVFGYEAKIGKQNYKNATCEELFSTDNKEEYEKQWYMFNGSYEDLATQRKYSILGENCQTITRLVLEKLNYKMPQAIEVILDPNNQFKINDQNCILN